MVGKKVLLRYIIGENESVKHAVERKWLNMLNDLTLPATYVYVKRATEE